MLDVRRRKNGVSAALKGNVDSMNHARRTIGATVAGLLLFCFSASTVSVSAAEESQSTDEIPEAIAVEMIQVALARVIAIDPSGPPILLSIENVPSQVLLSASADSVRLLTPTERRDLDDSGVPYHFFTEPEREAGGYCIGLLYGTSCEAEGPLFRFRVTDGRLRLRRLRSEVGKRC